MCFSAKSGKVLSDMILTQWQHPGASSEALDLLHWVMHVVTYRSISIAIKTASKVGAFFHQRLFAFCFCGHLGNVNSQQMVAPSGI
jgi:hypothetical protein